MPETLDQWLALLEQRHHTTIDLGLDRLSAVWARLGSPRPAKKIITVAGTNGKGSTVSNIDLILRSSRRTVGRYTSPHLLRFNERVVINGNEAQDLDLIHAFEMVESCLGNVSLSYFEFTTLAAFQLFHAAKLDYAVLEVGLGGRLDAVNLIDTDCAVITPVALDHQSWLGNSRELIGREKAGIMRADTPVVISDRNPPKSVLDHARSVNAAVSRIGEHFDLSEHSEPGFTLGGVHQLSISSLAMRGRHQRDNLAAALTVLSILEPAVIAEDQPWRQALKQHQLAGRLASHRADPRVLIDVGHNQHAAMAIARHLESRASSEVYCVLGMLKDKDAAAVAEQLSRLVTHWYCAGLTGERGRTGSELAATIGSVIEADRVNAFEDVRSALERARLDAADEDLILIFGSFETAAAAIRTLDENAMKQDFPNA